MESRLVAFVIVAALITVAPGPDMALVLRNALTNGRSSIVPTAAGVCLGLLVWGAASSIGVAAVLAANAQLFHALRLAGAVYLVFLGVQAIRHRRSVLSDLASGVERAGSRRAFRDGFVVGVSNPKSIILFAAILPQFVNRSDAAATPQLLVLGFMAVAIALVSDTVWAVVSGSVRAWISRSPRSLAALRGTGGLVMLGLGLRLAVTGRRD